MQELRMIFTSKAKAEAFMTWLCESGEQYYFTEMEDDACNSVSHFAYNFNHMLIHATGQLPNCSKEGA